MTVNQQMVDLGNIKFGQPHKFSYTVSNDTKQSAVITKLVTGCSSCTKAVCRRTYIRPGESSTIDVTFTPGTTGKQTKTVNIFYNNTEELLLKFTADVSPQ